MDLHTLKLLDAGKKGVSYEGKTLLAQYVF
jgi:hypothetical protein